MKTPKIFTHTAVFLPFYFFTFLLFASCSDDDGDLTPSNADLNGFAPAATDNSVTAQIRNEFFNATGTYLLFTDTLVSHSTNGQPELFDANYSITSSPAVSTDLYDYNYRYDYITDTETQRKAADILKNNLVSKLGKNLPFSFLLVDDIHYTNSYGRKRHLPMLIAPRGYVISAQGGLLYENPDSLISTLLADIVEERIKKADDAVTAKFYAFSKDYYSKDFEDVELNGEDFDNDPTMIWNYGMFEYGSWWGYFFYSKDSDTASWVEAVLSQDRETFAETYGESATMMAKYDALKEVINEMGFNI